MTYQEIRVVCLQLFPILLGKILYFILFHFPNIYKNATCSKTYCMKITCTIAADKWDSLTIWLPTKIMHLSQNNEQTNEIVSKNIETENDNKIELELECLFY